MFKLKFALICGLILSGGGLLGTSADLGSLESALTNTFVRKQSLGEFIDSLYPAPGARFLIFKQNNMLKLASLTDLTEAEQYQHKYKLNPDELEWPSVKDRRNDPRCQISWIGYAQFDTIRLGLCYKKDKPTDVLLPSLKLIPV